VCEKLVLLPFIQIRVMVGVSASDKYILPGKWAGMSIDDDYYDSMKPQFVLPEVAASLVIRLGFFCGGVFYLLFVAVFTTFLALIPVGSVYIYLTTLVFVYGMSFLTFASISTCIVTSLKILASLYQIGPSSVERLVFRVFHIGFTWFYDFSEAPGLGLVVGTKPGNYFLDVLASILANFLLWVVDASRLVKFRGFEPVMIHIPRERFVLPIALINDAVPTGIDLISLASYTAIGKIEINIWDTEAVKLCQPLIRLALSIGRFAYLARLSAWNLLYISLVSFLTLASYWLFLMLKFGKYGVEVAIAGFKLFLIITWVALFAPIDVLTKYSYGFWYMYWHLPIVILAKLLSPSFYYRMYHFAKTSIVFLILRTLSMPYRITNLIDRYYDKGDTFKTKIKLQARFNQSWVAAQRVVDDLALPTFIRRTNWEITPDSIQDTLNKLSELGWPVNVSTLSEPEDLQFYEYPEWFLTQLDFHQGIHNVQTMIDQDLQMFENDSQYQYKRTETYASYANELTATSRYFLFRDYSFTDLAVDDLWVLVGEIFKNSRLTPFNYIIRKWEKKYGLGAFAKVPGKYTERKLSRRKFINTIGLVKFQELWAETFKWAPTLDPLNPVSIKGEALPFKKWANDKVRTVIGAPLTSYISSTIWNYAPNHNFKWETTPIKVGMPLNGGSMSKIYQEHARRDLHFAGDCSAFDSTLSGKTLDIIKKVRKKGFEFHRDYKNICELIDNAYWEVENGVLVLTSRGAAYKKGTGLSTGHSSTSMDNSLGLVSLYLRAWKELTGHTAHEFRHFCTLSCYGDDNIISWDKDVHPNWTFPNIQTTFKKWGVDLREEAAGPLEKIEFLSKFGRRPNQQDRDTFAKHDLPTPAWIVYHNKQKLIGKIQSDYVGLKKAIVIKDQLTRIKSFIDLTAGHEDVYEMLLNAALKKVKLIRGRDKNFNISLPTYGDVLRNWYYNQKNIKGFAEESDIPEEDVMYTYGQVTVIDAMSNFFSRFADFVNPDVYNSGLTIFLQRPLKPFLEWALLFTREANGIYTGRHLASIVQKTAYDWITNEVEIPLGDDSSYATGRLIKHWIYMIFCQSKGGFFSRYILMMDKKLADIKYILFGHVDLQVRRLDIPIWNILLCAMLGWLPTIGGLPDYRKVPFWAKLQYVSFGWIFDTLFGMITNVMFASVPANFMASNQACKLALAGQPYIVEAATGSGKTTAMINSFLSLPEVASLKHLIVVEPRSSIVSGVVPYMKSKFGMNCTGATEGFIYDPKAKVIYATPMELVLHEEWINDSSFFVFDEAHVMETIYQFAFLLVKKKGLKYLLTSATPPLDLGLPISRISGAQVWSIDHVDALVVMTKDPSYESLTLSYKSYLDHPTYQFGFDIYRKFVSHYLSNANPFSKSLVFVNTKKEVMLFLDTLKGPSGGIVGFWSGHTDLPERWSVIVTTSVSDIGVTLPSVDHVFTTNSELVVRGYDMVKPVIYGANSALLKQRKGRTGRTNNGRFILFELKGLPEKDPFHPIENILNLISSGVNFDLIMKIAPEWLQLAFPNSDLSKLGNTFNNVEKQIIAPALRWQEGESSIVESLRLKLEGRLSKFTGYIDPINLQPVRNGVRPQRGWSVSAEILDFLLNLKKFTPKNIELGPMESAKTEVAHVSYVAKPNPSKIWDNRVKRDIQANLLKMNKNQLLVKKENDKAESEKIQFTIDKLKTDLKSAEDNHALIEQKMFNNFMAEERIENRVDAFIYPDWDQAFILQNLTNKWDSYLEIMARDPLLSSYARDARDKRRIHKDLLSNYIPWLKDQDLWVE